MTRATDEAARRGWRVVGRFDPTPPVVDDRGHVVLPDIVSDEDPETVMLRLWAYAVDNGMHLREV